MKNSGRFTHYLLMSLLAMVFVIAGSISAFADDTINLEDRGVTSGDDITQSLNEALEEANTKDGTLTVNVPAGEYDVSGNIYIFSNTVLNADGCTFNYINPDGGTMLKGAHKDTEDGERCRADEPNSEVTCSKGGYTQVQNVTINGGTWDASPTGRSADTQCIMFRHAENITLTGITAKGNTNHAFNISGVKDATITGCTFEEPLKYNGNDTTFWGDLGTGNDSRFNSMEAVHLDFTCRSGEPNGKPLDNTPCVNITVENCTFDGVFSGVGTHHANGDISKRANNITVRNCTFTNLASNTGNVNCYGRALTFYTADTVTFNNNTINGVYNAVLMEDVSNLQAYSNTKITNVKGNAFMVRKGCKGTIKNNEVISPVQTGVWVGSSYINVFDNTIKNAGTHGIYTEKGNGNTKISRNTITNPKKTGVYVNQGSTRVYKNKISGSTEQGVFLNAAGVSQVDENTISNSTKEGIYVYQSGSVKVLKNTINNSKKNGMGVMDSKTVIIKGNTISAAANNGMNILVSASGKTTIAEVRENTVKNCKRVGILLQDGTNSIIYKNTVTGNGANGIIVQGSKKKCTGSLVSYNIATGNKGKKDILLYTKCNNSRIQFNTVPKAGRLYCYVDGKVVNKGNHYTNAKTIKNAKITGITNKKYNKKAQGQPKLKVVVGGKTLKKNVHYKVTYENNVKKGTAKMYIIGQGAYKDYVTRTFKIQ